MVRGVLCDHTLGGCVTLDVALAFYVMMPSTTMDSSSDEHLQHGDHCISPVPMGEPGMTCCGVQACV